MKLDGVYYPLNDRISWLTTCMEEMRQDIAKIQLADMFPWPAQCFPQAKLKCICEVCVLWFSMIHTIPYCISPDLLPWFTLFALSLKV